ncbi:MULTISPECIES: YugN family protein [Jeotgalibacillus]|uniref:YugN family protein n=1 Tax=Jeotgalibacillus haloalkalitolerans TaxID=3104292 RepID=A0ABU5KJU8_9BACL|nr:YugN family protein [Jeotgalibacillus sp. HH7-29]MDZ5711534.1 YugN family protein [Jeotgalibacillus sp. HH7-29]
MRFENTGLESLLIEFDPLEDVMNEHGMVRAGQWDWERVTYDRKFEIREGTFYLRIFGYTENGDIGASDADVKLLTPLLGKHYYPHGVEYGEGEEFPEHLVQTCEKILIAIYEDLAKIAI